jgi:hypothetical protein
MAIVMQEVCGKSYGTRYYPACSGVARSINFYPIPPEKPEDGIATIALGLGKYVVDGGLSLRFSPKYPQKILQTSSPVMALRETQKHFYALNLDPASFQPNVDDAANLLQLRLSEAEKDGAIKFVCSTYDLQNDILRDGFHEEGKKIVTFSNILKHNTFPLARIIEDVLEIGQREMGKPIEIEFAVELNKPKDVHQVFYVLQIRPIVSSTDSVDFDIDCISSDKAIITTNHALGNGIMRGIRDFVYVRPEHFDPSKTREIAELVGQINKGFLDTDTNYILVGPGRWGSSDPWLGIPVKWPQISAARIIVESGLDNYRIDPSQGTHFFQNLTSFGVGYFTINPFIQDGIYDLEYLSKQEVVYEDHFIRHIRFSNELITLIDGRKNKGVILKEGEKLEMKPVIR